LQLALTSSHDLGGIKRQAPDRAFMGLWEGEGTPQTNFNNELIWSCTTNPTQVPLTTAHNGYTA
jgi:hypothetical protein